MSTAEAPSHSLETHGTYVNALYCPIAYGSMAFWLGRKGIGSDKDHTHKWTVFVRGAHGQDISYCVRKVVFTLHHSFSDPQREVLDPPYEVTETGWGEFEVGMRIYFHDTAQKPVSVSHLLKLHPPQTMQPSLHKPVVSETYDEIVFIDPTPTMSRLLALCPPGSAVGAPPGMAPLPLSQFFSTFDDSADLAAIAAAQDFVDQELDILHERLVRAQAEKVHIQETLGILGEDTPASFH